MKREIVFNLIITALVALPLLFVGCKKKIDEVEKTVITIKGSDTMVLSLIHISEPTRPY